MTTTMGLETMDASTRIHDVLVPLGATAPRSLRDMIFALDAVAEVLDGIGLDISKGKIDPDADDDILNAATVVTAIAEALAELRRTMDWD